MLHEDETNILTKRNSNLQKKMNKIIPIYRHDKNQHTVTTTQTGKVPKTPTDNTTEDTHMIPETNPSPEPTIIPETYPIPTTQPDETFDSPSLVTNNKDNFSKPASAISGNLQKLRNKKEIQLLPYQCTID